LGVLDTEPEPAFDDVCRLAAQLCGVPIALVSLVDAECQWFKARVGLAVVSDLVASHHGTLELSRSSMGGGQVDFALPAA